MRRGSRSIRIEASREHVPRTRTGFEPASVGPFPKCLIERVFEQGQSYTTRSDIASSRDARLAKNSSAPTPLLVRGVQGGVVPPCQQARCLSRGVQKGGRPRLARTSTVQSPQPIGNTSNVVAIGTPSRVPPAGRRPPGTPAGRSAPSPARRCRPGAPAATRRPGRRSAWSPRRARTGARTPPRPRRTPPQGCSPASSCSLNTQRFPASRTASRVAFPVAMWSAWFRFCPPQVSRKLLVITISGRCCRTAAQIARRNATPYSSTPSGRPRKSTVLDPDDPGRARPARPRGPGGPPPVASRRCRPPHWSPWRTPRVLPWSVQRATAAAAPNSRSSGCATTHRAVVQDSSTGSRSGMASA